MKQIFLLLTLSILLQSCFSKYPQGSGGYDGTNNGNSGGNQTQSGGDRPQNYPQQTPQEPTNYPSNPKANAGRSADKDLVVGNIRLTDQYTILYLTFTNKKQAGEYRDKASGKTVYDDGSQYVAFQENAVLIAANGARTFKAIKTDNIPFLSDAQAINLSKYGRRLKPNESINFVAYFERLDKGLESFDMNECNSDNYICWNTYDLYVKNPSDAVNQPTQIPTQIPPTNTDNTSTTPTKSRTKSGKVGEVDNTPKPQPVPVVTSVLVSGIVRDVKTNRPLSATIDYKLSSSKQTLDSVQSFASTGIYRMTLQKGQVYTYSASSRGYLVANDIVDLSKATGKVTKDIYLTPIIVGDKITLKNIYFEVSKSDLLPASFAELNKLVTMMEDNPLMEIRLDGHTDVVGDPEANLELSQERVDACETYMVRKGIPSARIQAVGYGDTKPIVKKGTDEERKVNRRVEFVVLKL